MKTMKKLLILLIFVAVAGCSSNDGYPIVGSNTYSKFKVVMIDGCEYLENTGSYAVSHKGDCKNPIHVYNKIETKVIPASLKGATELK